MKVLLPLVTQDSAVLKAENVRIPESLLFKRVDLIGFEYVWNLTENNLQEVKSNCDALSNIQSTFQSFDNEVDVVPPLLLELVIELDLCMRVGNMRSRFHE